MATRKRRRRGDVHPSSRFGRFGAKALSSQARHGAHQVGGARLCRADDRLHAETPAIRISRLDRVSPHRLETAHAASLTAKAIPLALHLLILPRSHVELGNARVFEALLQIRRHCAGDAFGSTLTFSSSP